MRQHVTILLTTQDELPKLYEARRQTFIDKKNIVILLTTGNNEFNERINGIVKQIAAEMTTPKKTIEDSKVTIAITSVINDRLKELTVFVLVHDLIGSSSENSSMATEIVPTSAAKRRECQDHDRAHACKIRKIPTSLKIQLEPIYENSSTPIKLADLQWKNHLNEESYRKYFLVNFMCCITKLRGLENYYAAKTNRYTIIQNRLLPCIDVSDGKRKCLANENSHRSLKLPKSLKEPQSYRIILDDKTSNPNTGCLETTETRNELQKMIIDDNSTLSEVENLRKVNVLLGRALRKSAELHVNRQNESDANLKEKLRLAEERRALEKDRNDLLAKKEELQRLDEAKARSRMENERLMEERRGLEKDNQKLLAQKKDLKRSISKASKLQEKERLLEETRRVLEQDKQKFLARAAVFERFNTINANCLREDIMLLEDQRQELEQQAQDLSAHKEELETYYDAKASRLSEKERSLGEHRQSIECDRQDLSAHKEKLESYYGAKASRLSEKKRSLGEHRQSIERDRQDLLVQKKELKRLEKAETSRLLEKERSLEDTRRGLEQENQEFLTRKGEFERSSEVIASNLRSKERSLEQDYEAKVRSLKETENTMNKQRRDLERCRQELLEKKKKFEEYYASKSSALRQRGRSMEKQREDLIRDRRDLLAQQEKYQQQNVARPIQPNAKESPDEWSLEIPIIQNIVSCKLRWPFFNGI